MKKNCIYNDLKNYINEYTHKNTCDPYIRHNITYTNKGDTIYFDTEKLFNLVTEIIEDSNYGKNFSGRAENFLEDKLMNMINEHIYIKGENTEDTVQKIIEMLKTKKVPYTFFIPTYGISVNSIFPQNFKNIALCSKKYKNKIIDPLTDTNDDNIDLNDTENNNEEKSFIMIKVYANNDETAEQLSLSYSNDLILALHSVYSDMDNAYIIGIGDIKDTNYLFRISYIINDSKIGRKYLRQNNKIIPLQIDLSLKNNENIVFKAFVNILNKKIVNDKRKNKNDDDDKLYDIENRLYVALKSIGKATIDNNEDQSLLNLMTAIEALVEGKDYYQSVTDQICERCAELLCTDPQEKLKIYTDLQNLYDKRSKITHGEKSPKVTANDLYFLRQTGLELCLYFLENIDRFKHFTENKNWKDYFLNLRFKQML
ncbi:HEPN domain-containing protein [Lactobacillus sp. ESL0259]|uniref:HEPN domain-containing protein n=1 Tax=Lactobacillus sp. ESL0259 TaxID=2069346 RepID=UPI000EFD6F0C|nr:HEPN domain-containing protein [Lactobacillus sp. ESL0259]RMC62296.1 hypothetical protein F5ESL0259_00110 [Lactobacillus sp. ESL0259]